MKNLAGCADCDVYIRRELTKARIKIVEGPVAKGEVPATLTGELDGFTFYRAWYYWVAKGDMPMGFAIMLYDDPIGRTDIRVDGHCGCPSPVEQGRRFVSSYHIDSMEGLRLFADTIVRNGIRHQEGST